MIQDYGTVRPGTTLYIPFHTFDSNDPSASVTLTGLATTDIEIYKDGGTTQRASDNGYALLDTDGIDIDGITGIHGISVNLADNSTAGFYAAGSQYWIVISSITVDAATINFILATFRIGYEDAVINTTIATLSSQTSFTLTAGPAEDDALNGCVVCIHDVASAVQLGYGVVSDYTGSTKTVTLAAGTTFTAAAADNISIFPPSNAHTVSNGAVTAIQNGLATAAAVDAVDNFIDTEVAAIKTVVDGIQTDLDNGTDGLGALKTLIDTLDNFVDTEMAAVLAAVDTEVAAIKAKTDLIPAAPAAVGDIPTAAAVADAVWDEAIAGHAGAGSTGEALGAAGSAGDPWTTALPGAYGAGSAGKIIGDNINATISSRASQTSVDDLPTNAELATALGTADDAVLASIATLQTYVDTEVAAILAAVDTEVAAIKAKTDNLPASPANEATLTTIAGYLDTEVAAILAAVDTEIAAIKAKTDNLPTDPADASDIAASFASIASTLSSLSAYVDTEVAAIKAKTDSLTFTVAGVVDSNIQRVNDVAVAGTGASGDEWGPA